MSSKRSSGLVHTSFDNSAKRVLQLDWNFYAEGPKTFWTFFLTEKFFSYFVLLET